MTAFFWLVLEHSQQFRFGRVRNLLIRYVYELFTDLRIGGRRGSPYGAPENTIEEFEIAEQTKCDLVKFDIHMTSDGVPAVLIHWMSLLKARVKDIKNIPLMVVGGIKAGIPTLVEDAEWCQQNNISTIVETADEKMLDCVMNVINFIQLLCMWLRKLIKTLNNSKLCISL
ncbi:unnamed protein product [Heligmosomoides polygyrus]|uniref:GP-PDE domain-containing protein n=1 Tax=Heligmosomoides polygyrus TaxID=6339 RepID=A0A183FYD8_HELPZ|nr:unnamed protein product [Heligmosomoides polygyrus]